MVNNRRDFNADRAICNAAQAGPWEAMRWESGGADAYNVQCCDNDVATVWQGVRYPFGPEISEDKAKANTRFIAEARTGWPAALNEIDRLKRYNRVADECLYAEESRNERLQAEIQRYRQALESLLSVFNGGYVTKNKPSAHVDDALRLAKEVLSYDGN